MVTVTRAGRAVVLFAWATFALHGCGPAGVPSTQPTAAATTQGTVVATPTPAATVTPAVPESLKFTATTIDGKPFDAATLAGKPVVLWFWAAWCPKCRAKSADVASVQKQFAGKVHVVGVAGLGSGDAAMKKFASDTGITGFPNLADDAGQVWKKFGVTSQEYFVILGTDGQIVHKGPLSGADLKQRAAALAG